MPDDERIGTDIPVWVLAWVAVVVMAVCALVAWVSR